MNEPVYHHPVTVYLRLELIHEALRLADIRRWCKRVEFKAPTPTGKSSPFEHPCVWHLVDAPLGSIHTVSNDFHTAINWLATNRFHVFCDLVRGDNLPTVGDYLIQAACYGSRVHS